MTLRHTQAALPMLILLALAAGVALAGDTLKEVGADAELAKRVKITKGSSPNEKGEGPTPHLAKLDAPPKRVALVSFYLVDPGKSTGSYYSSVRTFHWLTKDGASHFADRLYQQGLAGLRESLGRHGMELLTHDQFLDSDEKRRAYNDYELKQSMAVRLLLGAVGNVVKAANSGKKIDQSAVAPGYRLLPAHVGPADPTVGQSLNELREALGVDALLIVKNGLVSDEKNVHFADVQVMLYGPNPIAKKEGVMYVQYKEGQCYVDAILALKKPAEVAAFKKKAIAKEDYSGYEAVLAAAADRAMAFVAEKIAEQ